MRYFVVPTSATAQLPHPDRGGFIPPGGITLTQSGRLTDYVARGDVTATPLDAVLPTVPPAVDPLTDTLTVQHGNYSLQVPLAALRALLEPGFVVGTNVQAYDPDLAAIAALATTSFGRSLLTPTDAPAARRLLGLTNVADLAPSDLPLSTRQAAALEALKLSILSGPLMASANNLSEIAAAGGSAQSVSRSNLGLGEIATMSRADVIAALRDALNGKEF